MISREQNCILARAPPVLQGRFGLSSLTFTQSLFPLPLHPVFHARPRGMETTFQRCGGQRGCAHRIGAVRVYPHRAGGAGCSGWAPAAVHGPSPAAPDPRAGPSAGPAAAGERRGRSADRGGNMAAFLPNYETCCGRGITGESRPGRTPGRGAARGWEQRGW